MCLAGVVILQQQLLQLLVPCQALQVLRITQAAVGC
jgi:hypothetical protein